MGAAPIIGAVAGGVSTVAQISAQRRQAAAQRQQIEASRLAAEQNYELSRRRFDYARSNSAQMYLRERAILDAQSENARTQFAMSQAQQEQQNIAQRQNELAQNAQINTAIQSLLSQASQVRGQGDLQAAGVANTLSQVVQQNDERSQATSLAQRGQNPVDMMEIIGEVSLLDTVAQLQAALESGNTIDRVFGAQAGAAESSASQLTEYQDLINQFFDSQRGIQGRYQDAVNRIMPSILDLQAQRNQVGLEAERFAREAEANIGQQASAINLTNQNRMANAQLNSVQGPNFFGAIGSLAQNLAQPIGTLVAQRNSVQTPPFNPNWQFQGTTNFSQFQPSVSPYRPIANDANGLTFPTILDVQPEIPVYG